MDKRKSAVATFVFLCLSQPSRLGASSDAGTSGPANCSAACLSYDDTRAVVCHRVCAAVEAMADEPCGKDLLTASPERLHLLSFSSGNVLDALSIVLDQHGNSSENATAAAFRRHDHVIDGGSPVACNAIQNAHFCVTMTEAFAVATCLPTSCDTASVRRLVGNITASGIIPFADDDTGSGGEEGGSGDDPDPDQEEEFEIVCQGEDSVRPDAGSAATFCLIGALIVLSFAGAASERGRPFKDRAGRVARHGYASVSVVDRSDEDHPDTSSGEAGVGALELASLRRRDGGEQPERGADPDEWSPAADRGESVAGELLLVPRTRTSASAASTIAAPNAEVSRTPPLESLPCWQTCLECFSLTRNVRQLLAPSRAGNEFGALDGVRTLSMLWIVLGHTFEYMVAGPIEATNFFDVVPVDGHGFLARLSGQLLTGAHFAVDTFFLMSGFLLSITLLTKLDDEDSVGCCTLRAKVWWAKAWFHRYARLTPTLAFVTIMTWKVLPLLGEGPLWGILAHNLHDGCSRFWWAEVTYLTNLTGACVDGTWYLANDMQMFLASVPLVMLFHSRPRKAVIVALAIVIISCGATLAIAFAADARFSVFAYSFWTGAMYNLPVFRWPVYIVGLLSGFAWFRYRGLHVSDGLCQKDGPHSVKAQAQFLDCHRGLTQLVKVAAVLFLALPVFGSYRAYQDAEEAHLPAWLDHLYLAFSRVTWALGVACMCWLCFSGHGGLVNWLLTRPIFATLSRLCYCVYFAHLFLLPWRYWSRDAQVKFTPLELSYAFMGTALGSFAAASVLYVLVEAPCRNLQAQGSRHDRRGRTAY